MVLIWTFLMTNEVEKRFTFYCSSAYPRHCKAIQISFALLLSAWKEMDFFCLHFKNFIIIIFYLLFFFSRNSSYTSYGYRSFVICIANSIFHFVAPIFPLSWHLLMKELPGFNVVQFINPFLYGCAYTDVLLKKYLLILKS